MQSPESEQVTRIARQVAADIETALGRRLVEFYGSDWLIEVNRQIEARGKQPIETLSDHRACLAVFGYDRATEDWAPEDLRRTARKLVGMATAAAHDKAHNNDLRQARSILRSFRDSPLFSAASQRERETRRVPSQSGSDNCDKALSDLRRRLASADGVRPSRGDDVNMPIILTSLEARDGARKNIPLDHKNSAAGSLAIQFPPNLADMTKLRVQGKGMPGKNGGAPGDLYITVFTHLSGGRDPQDVINTNMGAEAIHIARALHLTGSGWNFLTELRKFANTLKKQGTREPEPLLQHARLVLLPPIARIFPVQRVESFLRNANIYEIVEAIHELERQLDRDPWWRRGRRLWLS